MPLARPPEDAGVPGRHRGRPRRRRGWATLGWVLVAAGALLLTLGAAPGVQLVHPGLAAATAFVPYGTVVWLAASAALVLAGGTLRRVAALGALVAVGVHALWTVPYWPRPAPPPRPAQVTVFTANLYYGRADVDALASVVARHDPDVVVLQEVPEPTLARLRVSSVATGRPHVMSAGQAPWGAEGSAIFSRFPLEPLASSAGAAGRGAQLVVRVPGPGRPFTLVAVHTTNPLLDAAAWRADLDAVGDVAAGWTAGPIVVAGDFNATLEHEPLRRLLADAALADAAVQAGAGWLPTFPARHGLPLVGLDHILVGGGVQAHAVWSVKVDGSDHRGLVARISMP